MLARSPPPDPAAQAAAEEAFRKSTIEIWTLFAIGVSATVLRTSARVSAVGFRNLRPDDYLVWVGVILYACQSALGYSIGNSAKGLANNSLTDAERAALSINDPEYQFRVIGSKIQVAGWTVYSGLISALKLSVLSFYIRLTEGLGRRYRIQIQIGFALVIGTFFGAIITIFTACRPFHRYWQIYPDPGNFCQAGVSKPIIWISFAANVLTDIYLILIPLPMLWRSRLRMIKKIASSIVLGAGVFVLVCATLKSVFVLVDPVNGPQLAGTWGVREAFVAVMTTNLPMIFPVIRSLLTPLFGKALASTQKKSYKSPAGVQTIGGGGGGSSYSRNRHRREPPDTLTTGLTLNGSEERIVECNIKMQELETFAAPASVSAELPSRGILVSNSVEVLHEDRRSSHNGEHRVERVREAW
ncbi:uncharacterized protein CIMG_11576 [Coccidioides immitis RS]|uniref:Rhodopsin domain-containing protein n=2 Tax=Coccidioides TaxID=5500 RepID=A0A0D8JWA2_COCIM|nr:uncharacterized protein CIMG_11576 [Coccidioides immitis RS]KJF61196.1 hypothetical protein CIMG_11576 [Coccidioides immitis RS]KMM71029.1 hypothetical protein CPAG_07336 [Coccidioides posadasii RMSCC 3488]